MQEVISLIYDTDRRARKMFERRGIAARTVCSDFDMNHRIVGIVWLRWVGKTTFLLSQRSQYERSVYMTVDRLELRRIHLFDVVAEMSSSYEIQTFYIDEIHYLTDRQVHLKNIYDLLDVRIVFSGSSSISINKSAVDLSRRVQIWHMPVFSYREFLEIKKWVRLERSDMSTILEQYIPLSHTYIEHHTQTLFAQYLDHGQFGYAYESESDYSQMISRSMSKFVYEDLAQFSDIQVSRAKYVEDTLYYLGKTGTTEVSVNSLAKKLWLSPVTVSKYMVLLDEWWIVDILMQYGNLTDRLRKERKYYFSTTNFLHLFEADIWLVRETFVNMCLQHSSLYPKKSLHAPKTFFQKEMDFVWEWAPWSKQTWYIEVWWPSKTRDDVLVVQDGLDIWYKNYVPMWLLGMT